MGHLLAIEEGQLRGKFLFDLRNMARCRRRSPASLHDQFFVDFRKMFVSSSLLLLWETAIPGEYYFGKIPISGEDLDS